MMLDASYAGMYPQYSQMMYPGMGGGMFPFYREPTGTENLAGIIKSLAGARYNLNPMNLGPMRDIAGQIGNLAQAQIDPSNPLYQRTYEHERGQSMQDLSAAIAEMQRHNRLASRMGRAPLLSPERGGETIFRTMTRGYQDAQGAARARALDILKSGQGAMGNVYSTYGTLAGAQDTQKKKKAFGIGNLADMLPALGRLAF